MGRKTDMIITGIKLLSKAGKIYAIGKTTYNIVNIGLKMRKGAKVAGEVKEKTSKVLKVVKSIGVATDMAATATQVVSEISTDAKDLTKALKTKKVNVEKSPKNTVGTNTSNRKKNR